MSTGNLQVCTFSPVVRFLSFGLRSMGNLTVCNLCAVNTFARHVGSMACTSCPAGTYSVSGASTCLGCPTGRASPGFAIAVNPFNLSASTSDFAVISSQLTGSGDVVGDVAAGFVSALVQGNLVQYGTPYTQALSGVQALITALSSEPCTTISLELGGTTLTPGAYCRTGNLQLTLGTLTFDAQWNTGAFFLVHASSQLFAGAGTSLTFVRGAQPCQVIFLADLVSILANAVMQGTWVSADAATNTIFGNLTGAMWTTGSGVVNLVGHVLQGASCQTINCTLLCPPGSFVFNATCPSCPANTFTSTNNTAAACTNCTRGYDSPPGSSNCTLCAPGKYSPAAGVACVACPQGQTTFTAGAFACQRTVDPCRVNNGNCSRTPASFSTCTIVVNATRNCTACNPGFGSPTTASGYSNCTACKPGFASSGPSNCQPCRPGSFAGATGSANCSMCGPGTFSNTTGASTCIACLGNTVASNANTSVCAPCPPDTVANTNHTLCVTVNCTAGFGRQGSLNCTVCRPGSFSGDGVVCITCAPGTFSNSSGATTCLPCFGNTVAATSNTTVCAPCPADTVASRNHTLCMTANCTAGFGRQGSPNCTACRPGSFSSGDSACVRCPPGTFSNNAGATTCLPCADGSVAANYNTTVCAPCGNGFASNSTRTGCVLANCTAGFERLAPTANCTALPCNKTRSCSVNHGGCFNFPGTCADTVCGVTCTCPEHFQGDGVNCTDINECLVGHPCPNGTTCFNSIGSFECIGCPAPFNFSAGQIPVLPLVNLTAASSYAIVANTSVLASFLILAYGGNVGVFPGTVISNVVAVQGVVNAGNAAAQQALAAANAAYAALRALPCTIPLSSSTIVSGTTLTPGVYCWPSNPAVVTVKGNIVLDGQQIPNAPLVFQVPNAFNVSNGAAFTTVNGSRPCNVFWAVGGSATIDLSQLVGNLIARQNITVVTDFGPRIIGRAFSLQQGVFAPGLLVDSSSACAVANCTCPAGTTFNVPHARCEQTCHGQCGAFRNCTVNAAGMAICGRCFPGFISIDAIGNCTAVDNCPALSPLLSTFALSSPTTVHTGNLSLCCCRAAHHCGAGVGVGIFGNVSVNSAPAFAPPIVLMSGQIQTQNAVSSTVQQQVSLLYLNLLSLPCTQFLNVTNLAGLVLVGGNVYCFPANPPVVTLNTATPADNLTLSVAPNERLVVRIPSTFSVGPSLFFTLAPRTLVCNVFWVASNFTLESTEGGILGNVVVRGSTALIEGGSVLGSLFSVNGPVSLNDTALQLPDCANQTTCQVKGGTPLFKPRCRIFIAVP